MLALFVALGGSSYAALKINGKNIKNRTIVAKKVKKGTLTNREVKNKSLLRADFKPGQIPAGATGPAGEQGATGAAGPANVVMRKGVVTTVQASGFGTASAFCLSGERATGGGAFNEDQVKTLYVTSTYPLPNSNSSPATGDNEPATGWKVWMGNTAAVAHEFQAYVMCVSP